MAHTDGGSPARSEKTPAWRSRPGAAVAFGAVAALLLLYELSGSNYLLFHSVVELGSASPAVAVFMMAWTARHWATNDFLVFLGLGCLFVGAAEALHALAFVGMGIFPSFGEDEPIQFAVLARYVQGTSLLLAPTFLRRKLSLGPALATYAIVVGLLVLAIAYWRVFPQCVDETLGRTTFKLASRYVFLALLALAILRLHNHKLELEPHVARCLVAAILLSAATEVAMTVFVAGSAFANVAGHLLKGLSFIAMYCAVVEKGFREPSRRLLASLSGALDDAKRERDLAQRYLDIVGVIILALDSTGRVALVNQKGAQVLGSTPEELVGVDFFRAFVPPDECESTAARYRHLLDDGSQVCVRTQSRIVTRSGQQRIISWRISVVVGADGVLGTLNSGEDITEHLRSTRMVTASEKKYRTLFERSMDAICLVGLEGTLIDANPAFMGLCGLEPEAIGLLNVGELYVASRDRARLLEESALHEGGIETRAKLKKASGAVMDCRVSTVPLRDGEGKLVALQSVVRDVTDETKAQVQLTESREQLRRLARRIEATREEERTGIARELHDQLGQALTALKMDLGSVSRSLQKGRSVEPELLRQMTQLVDATIHDVQRISSDLRPGILDDLGFVEAVRWQLARFRDRTGIPCHLSSTVDGEGLSRSASTALFRVFQELLTNIARHAAASTVRVEVAGDGETITLTVADDGRGITREQIEARESLGLIGIRERVLAVGGCIEIRGEAGRGTTTRVSAPLSWRAREE
jgi:PAS domain S-box-containing protein